MPPILPKPLDLPKPDNFGNYVLRDGNKVIGGIWSSKHVNVEGVTIDHNTWFATLTDQGAIWERKGNEIKLKMFHTPKEALIELNKVRR